MKCIFVIATFLASTNSLAPYIKPCHLKKPDYDKCALGSANYAVPFLAKGDKANNIPPMNPLRLPLVEISQNNFKLALSDVGVFGLERAVVKKIKMNETNIDLTLGVDRLSFIGKYAIDGKIVFLALKGSGPSNITSVGGNYRFIGTFDSVTKDQLTYLRLNRPIMEYTVNRTYFRFENLLSSNDNSGIDINRILNDNWEDVVKDIDVAVKDAVTAIVETIANRILENEPVKDIFPE